MSINYKNDKKDYFFIEKWINIILKERICKEINIEFNPKVRKWKLSIFNENLFFFPIFDDLYKLGYQQNLPCSIIKITKKAFIDCDKKISAPGLENNTKKLYLKKNNQIHFNYDVIGLIYWILSRSEEVNATDQILDNHNRFSVNLSHAYLNNYLDEPIIDQWINILRDFIKYLFPRIELTKNNFSFVITHDVDRPSKYKFANTNETFRHIFYNIFKKPSIKELKIIAKSKFLNSSKLYSGDPYNTFDWLLKVNDENNIKSIFYFLFSNKVTNIDPSYKLDSAAINDLIIKLIERNNIIGLHSSYKSHYDLKLLNKEVRFYKNVLNQNHIRNYELHHRSHYLRWRSPHSAENLSDLDIHYDSTLGYSQISGFRCGTCIPYKMINPINKRILKITQKPLIVMDDNILGNFNLYDPNYVEKCISKFKFYKEKVKKVKGEFNVLWHNCNLVSPEQKQIYENLIKYI